MVMVVLACSFTFAAYAQRSVPRDPAVPAEALAFNIGTPRTAQRAVAANAVTAAAITPELLADSLALLELYDSMGGPNWTNQTNWKTGKVATWYGVIVKNGRVTEVTLTNNNLTGTIPAAIGNLTAINWLRLYENHLTGRVPETIGNLTACTRLMFYQNQITGGLPESIGQMTALQMLMIQDNLLTGSIPSSIGNLKQMTLLYLYRNKFTGDLPSSLGTMTKLTTLAFHVNDLTGNFDWIGNLTALTDFYFYGNPNLDCTIPVSIGNLTKMTTLAGGGWMGVNNYLHSKVHGTLPTTLKKCVALESVYLDDSEFEGDVSSVFTGLPKLTGLYLFNNPGLVGNVATIISGLPKLASVSISNTGITGTLPATGPYATLTLLDLTNSGVRGALPDALANATNLKTLNVGGLEMTTFPSWMTSFPGIAFTNWSHNKLESIPDFSTHANKANLTYWVNDNKLDFGDLEPHFTAAGVSPYSAFVYAPQEEIGEAQHLYWPAGSTDTLKVTVAGSVNLYQWQKRDAGGAWADINNANIAALIFTPVAPTDSGHYRLKVTNERVTGLTLYSQPIHVEVTDAIIPPDAADQRICAGQTVPLTAVGTGSIFWYSMSAGGVQLATGSPFVTPPLDTTTIFFVSQIVDGIESLRRPVTVVVDSLPDVQAGEDIELCTGKTTMLTFTGDAAQVTWTGLGNEFSYSVKPTVTTTYTLTGVGANGCQATDVVVVKVLPLPTVTISPTAPTVCGGGSVVLTAAGGISYVWNTGEGSARITVSPTVNTAYTVTATDVKGCQRAVARTVKVDATCPVPPKNVRAVALTANKVQLTWTNITGDQTGLKIERKSATGAFQVVATLPGAATSYDDASGLQPSTEYTYRIRSARGSSESPNSEEEREETFSQDQNYIRETDVLKDAVTNVDDVSSLAVGERIHRWNYLDGEFRPVQSVAQEFTPGENDLVSPIEYDGLGRQPQEYLPYTLAQTHPGEVRTNALGPNGEQARYYDGTTTPAGVATEADNPYSETAFERSPFSRAVKQAAPGQSWKLSGDHTTKLAYGYNNTNEVLIWRVTDGTLVAHEYFDAFDLNKLTSVDEEGNQTIAYQDQLGRTVLLKSQGPDNTWASTYRVYDLAGNMTHQISPLAVAKAEGRSGMPKTVQAAEIDGLCLVTKYDARNRLLEKKSPGVAPVYYVYDRWGRLVLMQNGKQRAFNQWTCVKYDRFNRSILSGLMTDNRPAANIQASLDTDNSGPRYDSRTDAAGNVHGYTNQVFPTTIDTVLSVTYYDDYSFVDTQVPNAAAYHYKNASLTGLPAQPTTRVEGVVTGIKRRVLDTDDFLWAVSYYDDQHRLLQTANTNPRGGVDRLSNVYQYPGWLERSKFIHAEGSSANTHAVVHRYTYDHVGRVEQTFHSIDGAAEVLLCDYDYNELGQVIKKRLHQLNAPDEFLQSIDYTYNIRGWLTGINTENPAQGDAPDYFVQALAYDAALGSGNTQRYDGSASATAWKDDVGTKQQGYNYTYDKLSRLTHANYAVKDDTPGWELDVDAYSEKNIAYDLNGNIRFLDRYTPGEVADKTDQLVYTYGTNGNQLLRVEDTSTSPNKEAGFENGNAGTDDYAYDANGNCTRDLNKGITFIRYNTLNLPARVTFSNGTYIEYTYDAAGTKIRQAYYTGQPTPQLKTDYSGSFVYDNDTLTMIEHAEGRYLTPGGLVSAGTYQYYLVDHVGSPRVIIQPPSTARHESLATSETEREVAESSQFVYYDDAVKVDNPLFNHTPDAATHYSLRLNGTGDERIGLGKSLSVMPGDTVRMEVFAKYLDPDADNWSSVLANFVQTLAAGTAPTGTVVDGGAPGSIGGRTFPWANLLDKSDETGNAPRAYLNYLVFNRQDTLIDFGYVPLTEAAKEKGDNGDHERLFNELVVKEAGYVYVFLSNDNVALGGEPVEVYFDDFKVELVEGPVVQVNGYYPYGMQAYSYRREGEALVHDLFQRKVYDSLTQWHDFHARQYDAALGRWIAADPAGQFSSPYLGMGNNPIRYTDPNGEWIGWDDLVVAAVGFVYGYVSYGIEHDEWGGKAFANGGIQAAIFELGYLTGGGGLALEAGASATASVAMEAAGSYLVATAVNVAASEIMPSIPIYQDDNFSISVSPSLSLQGMGASVSAMYSTPDFAIGAGFGINGAAEVGYGGSIRTGELGYSYYHYGGVEAQGVGEIYWTKGDYWVGMSNDLFGFSGDKFRTAGFEARYQDYSVGILLHTGDPNVGDERPREGIGMPGDGKNGHYSSASANDPGLRLGAVYGGYKGQRAGWSSDGIRHVVQDVAIHDGALTLFGLKECSRKDMRTASSWFAPLKQVPSQLYFSNNTGNPFSMWGY
jgi:RHS repeat-associated protein